MQRGRRMLDSSPETSDLNQGLVPSSSLMDQSSPWDNLLDPVASEGKAVCTSASSFSGWDQGEPSSAANLNDRMYCSNLKAGHGSEERGFELSIDSINEGCSSTYGGNYPVSRPSTHRFNSNPQPEDVCQQNNPYNSFGNSGILPPFNAGFMDQRNTRNEPGSLNIDGVAQGSTRISAWENIRNQDSVSFGLSPVEAAMVHSTVSSNHLSPRLFSMRNSPDMRQPLSTPMNSSHSANQSHSFPWNGLHELQGNNSGSFRSSLRNIVGHRRSTEARNYAQDTGNWNLASVICPQNIASGSGTGPASPWSSHTMLESNQNTRTSTHHRLPEFSPWTLFPPQEPEPASQRAHISLPHSATTSEEPVMSNRRADRQSHPYTRSPMIVEAPVDDRSGWGAVAADIEGRHRMVSEIRQVLNAMRRVENLQDEDYMMFEPYIHVVAEMPDRHRDMRLDVDNMSYEELLALEERIGDVNTGLNEESILRFIKQKKHTSTWRRGLSSNLEPCCICQEEYVNADNIGILECGHEFHTNCIKQWLLLKNLCPICKVTGLNTIE